MQRRTQTFEVEYNYFEPGERVRAISHRFSAEPGKVYTVTRCAEPLYAGDGAVVFFEGEKYGHDADWFEVVTDETPT